MDTNKTTLIFSNINENSELTNFLSSNSFDFEPIVISNNLSEQNFKIKMGNDLLSFNEPIFIFNVYYDTYGPENVSTINSVFSNNGLRCFINEIPANFDDVKLVGRTDNAYDITILKILGAQANTVANTINTDSIKIPIISKSDKVVTTIL